MINIVFIRHAKTEWNLSGVIQGHTDIPLCEEGIANAKELKLDLENFVLWSSPLKRAVKTGRIIFSVEPRIEDSLIEMNWGNWEGKKISDLRKKLGTKMKKNENLGLDMRPDKGETPREVQKRLIKWFETLHIHGNCHVCITHKGVIRSTIALATNWDMIDKSPIKISSGKAYSFNFSKEKKLTYTSTIPLSI